MNTDELKIELENLTSLINNELNVLFPPVNVKFGLDSAMRYSVLSSGKRLRPLLLYFSACIFEIKPKHWLRVALALELIHNYSLIHDDLPSMDNDDFRRGQLTCHKKFNEPLAILAGDALLTYAFEILADSQTHPDGNIRGELIACIARSIGKEGMVKGQALDIETKNKIINADLLLQIQCMKTGYLFGAACEAGAILSGQTEEFRKVLRECGHHLGIAYQIKDDIEDSQHQPSLYNPLLNDKEYYICKAVECLKIFGPRAKKLEKFAQSIIL